MIKDKDYIDEHDDLEEILDESVADIEPQDLEENSIAKIKKLTKKLRECETEKMTHLENLQRAKAEFLNAKKRIEQEKIADRERTIINHIEKLLPLCDSFQMAQSDKKAWDAIDDVWRKGIESIQNQLTSLLSSYGVSEVRPMGLSFDPSQHEAVSNVEVQDASENEKIVAVVQSGFVRTAQGKEYLIRPARVVVGELKK